MKRSLKRLIPLFLLLALIALSQTPTPPKPLTNSDIIEMSRAGVPQSTILTAIETTPAKFDVSADGILALHAAGVAESVLNQMLRRGNRQTPGANFGVATGTFPVKDAVGKTAHFSAWIKTENVLNGYAGIWWRVDGQTEGQGKPPQQLAFDNSQARFIMGKPDALNGTLRGATGTTAWTLYQFDLPVDATAKNINFGVLFTGTGTAWVDNMKIELDSEPWSNPQTIDLDFESPLAQGFYTGGTGYKVGIDNATSFTGHQSLKMQYVGDAPPRT